MAAVLKIGNFIEVPVKLEINDGGKTAVFSFKFTAKRLDADQWQSHFGSDGEHKDQLMKDFLLDHITDWHGQTLVIDPETNKPAPYTRENMALMLSVLGVQGVVFAAYVKEVSKAKAPEAKAKN